jgi:glucose-1-phosphate thymidylyltransferase
MKIIIPMAGRGSRLRPHTLTVPKPLISVAGKPIVQRLVEDLAQSFNGAIEEVAFITGEFGEDVERQLIAVAKSIGAKGTIYKQDMPLGIAHAIGCAGPSLVGNVIVAFADTLFRANFTFNPKEDGIVWTQKVEDPSAFGVVKLDQNNHITDFVEKPQNFVSNLAIVGIYYFNSGEKLREEIEYLIKNDNTKFRTATIDEWIDCGNKEAVVHANKRMLEIKKLESMVAASAKTRNSVIIQPCYLADGVNIKDSVVGPYVSIGRNTTIEGSVIDNSVIGEETTIIDSILSNSMVGNYVEYIGRKSELSISDYSKFAS